MIALVVTIIVLLILAAVAINLTIGENGIFTRAQNATEKWQEAEVNEQDEMNKTVNFIDNYTNGSGSDEIRIEGVKIPKGFYYVGGTKATGIVISDAKADENVYSKDKHEDQANIPGDGLEGNQFVWVPVDNSTDFRRYSSYSGGGSTQLYSNYDEPAQEEARYSNEVKEYNAMMQSVEDNHGFYVARYEAGKENINGIDTVVSKKNVEVWNKIPWGNSMTEIGTEGAVAKAQGMYTNKETHNVTSTLIYGTQWDTIMAWIDPAYKTSTCANDSFVRNSIDKGNYSYKIAECGSSDSYRVNNIYDLAGNVDEWTMESYYWEGYSGSPRYMRVIRGGNYSNSGTGGSVSFRSNLGRNPNYPSDDTRFPRRFILVERECKGFS